VGGETAPSAPSEYVIRFSVWTDQGGRSHTFAAVAMHVCIIEEAVRVIIILLFFRVVCHELLLNCY
jgi:hypothetical protein